MNICGGSGDDQSTGGGGGVGPCGACKFLRRKCLKGCVFAPYFDSDQGTAHFAAVHRVFGASNASKLLLRIPPYRRFDAVITLCYEALARARDPVHGCVGHVFSLQQQVVNYRQSRRTSKLVYQPLNRNLFMKRRWRWFLRDQEKDFIDEDEGDELLEIFSKPTQSCF